MPKMTPLERQVWAATYASQLDLANVRQAAELATMGVLYLRALERNVDGSEKEDIEAEIRASVR